MISQNVIQKGLMVSKNFIAAQHTVGKIRSFSDLVQGWHYGTGSAPSSEVIEESLRIHSAIISLGFGETDAFPGIDGEVLIAAYFDLHYIDVLIEENGLITLTYEFDDAVVSSESDLTEVECRKELSKVAGKIWKPYASCIFDTSIVKDVDLQVWRSKIHQKERGFQSLSVNAYYGQAPIYVTISKPTIKRPQGTLPFFGYSILKSSHQPVD
ncbi:MAG TPA: hypothetical protein VHY35_23255 [Stellaceae bacterium]|jgi:hypothetical protein|nr:hypothetical protein [Stellaceae bacterium]